MKVTREVLDAIEQARKEGRVSEAGPGAVPAPEPVSEKEFQAAVVAEAQRCGWRVAHFRPGRTAHGWRTAVSGDGQGYPDLTLLRGARLIFAELKVGKNDLTAPQRTWVDELRQAPAEVYVWRPEDWKLILEVLQ